MLTILTKIMINILMKWMNFMIFLIQPSDLRIDLKDAIDLILDFNETIQLHLVQKYKN